jgi:ribosomal protein L20A (L18A)
MTSSFDELGSKHSVNRSEIAIIVHEVSQAKTLSKATVAAVHGLTTPV